MKNVRKAIALILTVVMVLGLAPVTARAAYNKTSLWDFAGGTVGATPSGATISTSYADRGTVTATVSADGGCANGKSIRYTVSDSATNAVYQTQTMRLAGGSINEFQLSAGDIFWFYLKSETDVNYSMLVQFRVGGTTYNYSTTTVYTVDGNGNVSTINRVDGATIADNGLALEKHNDNGVSRLVIGSEFEGWVGIPIISTDTGILGGTLQAVDFFLRSPLNYISAVREGSSVYFDNITVTSGGFLPVSSWLSQPSKTEYSAGESIDTTGGSIRTGNIDGSSYYDLSLTSDMISGFDPYRAGAQTVNCDYEGQTFSYDVTVAAAGNTKTFLWDVDTAGDPSFVFPSHDTTANRGAFDFSIVDGAGVDGSKAFAMTVSEVSTYGGIINGTLQKQNWSTAGVTGFTASEAVTEGDICWFWVDNELGSNQYVVAEFVYENNGTYYNNGTPADNDRTELIYTVSGGKVVPVNPATTIGGIRNVKSGRGVIQVYDGTQGWIGIPLWDVVNLRGKSVVGIRLYTRSAGGDDNGTVGNSIYFDEFTICSLGFMPGRDTMTVINVTTLPTKTSYSTGEAFKPAGGVLTVSCGGLSYTVPLTIDMISGYDSVPSMYGTQTITVTYEEMTTTFDITVEEDASYYSYAQCLLDIDALNSESTLPSSETQKEERGVTNVSVENKGLLGTNALALTVVTPSTDSGIQNGVTGNWSSVTGFTSSREIRKGDIFWVWVDNKYSTTQFVVFEFRFNDGGNTQAGTKAASNRTTPIYTISDNDGTPEITTIRAGRTVNGIRNEKAPRGVVKFESGVSGWLGIPLDDIVATNNGRLWGSSISGIRIYTRSVGANNNSNGEIGDAIYFDEPWVTSAGSMPALADNLLLNQPVADAMRLELRETVTAAFFVSPDVEVGEDDNVVFHVSMGGLKRDVEGSLVTDGAFAGKYSIYVDNIIADRYTDFITGTIAVVHGDESEHVFKTVTSENSISVAGYCDRLIATYPDDTTLQNLMANLLLFGDEAQRYTSHNIGSLPTTGRSWVDSYKKSFDIPGSDMAVVTPAVNTSVASIRSAALRISGKVAIRFIVQAVDTSDAVVRVTDDDSGAYSEEFSLADDESVTALGGNKYEVVIETILPQHYGKVYTAEMVVNGDTVHAVTYSVNSYIYSKHADSDVGGFVTALNNYGCAAVAYVANH